MCGIGSVLRYPVDGGEGGGRCRRQLRGCKQMALGNLKKKIKNQKLTLTKMERKKKIQHFN